MQTRELLPISRVIIGSRCGIIISLAIPAATIPAGINSSHPQPLNDASGRERCRPTTMAEIASASVITNFRSKNGLCIAVMMSGRTPSAIDEPNERNRRCGQQGKRQYKSDRAGAVRIVGGKRSNELFGFHPYCSRNLAVRLASARCNATRTAPSLIANFVAVSLIEVLSTAIDCKTSR